MTYYFKVNVQFTRKLQQDFDKKLSEVQKQYVNNLKRIVTKLEAEHVTDLLIQDNLKSEMYHDELKELETSFENWFISYYDTEVAERDFATVAMKLSMKRLEKQNEIERDRVNEIFIHFQNFINFALKEVPGQAEFLLSLEKVLQSTISKVSSEIVVK